MNQSKRRMMGILSTATMAGVTGLATSASWAQQKTLKAQLAGAWTLVSADVTPKGGTKGPSNILGPNPKGILILDAGGRYASVTGRPDRPNLKTPFPRKDIPAAELAEVARGYGASFGTWSVNEGDKTLVRKTELALIPNNIGTETKASVTLSKDELRLVWVSAIAGAKSEFVYRRAK